jgi:hypothetical protein
MEYDAHLAEHNELDVTIGQARASYQEARTLVSPLPPSWRPDPENDAELRHNWGPG